MLTGPLPVRHGEGVEGGLRVMLGDLLGLGSDHLRKARGEHLGHLAMELLARVHQQRLIGHFLDEDMLKGVQRCREELQRGEQFGSL